MKLAAGEWTMGLAPDRGGAITGLRWRGEDILRPAREDATDLFLFSSFAMVPYANRIAHGRLDIEGVQARIPANHPDQAHPLHGVGWLRAWTCTATDETSATLAHEHAADEHWPWAYRASQHFLLDAGGLDVSLQVTNLADHAMPASLGFHPYFATDGVTSLRFEADGVWMRDAECLPTELAPAGALGDWAHGESPCRERLIDNSYAGWSGRAHIARPSGDILLIGTNTPVFHLCAPPGADFFCAEPATAIPDAANRGEARILPPGESFSIAMRIGQSPQTAD